MRYRCRPASWNWTIGASFLHTLRNPQQEISIAVVGKYAEHRDAYKSIYEALDHAESHIRRRSASRAFKAKRSSEKARNDYSRLRRPAVPGGFGERGIEGKVESIRFARERQIPFLGICLGMQCCVIEFARNVIGLAGAHSTEFSKDTPHPVICLLDEQNGHHRQRWHDAAWRAAGRARSKQPRLGLL